MLTPRLILALAVLLAIAPRLLADVQPVADARLALAKATDYLVSISTEGGYLWRYLADLKQRRGEEEATDTQVWIQSPGTPAVGMAFLDAYKATGDPRHLRAAQAAAVALVRGQLESGGWAYLIEFDPAKRSQWNYRVDTSANSAARQNTTTFDDDNTQSALRFLMAYVGTDTNQTSAELKRIREALDYGLAKMIEAQYPNGAWPQRWDGKPHDPARHPIQKARIPTAWPREWPRTNYSQFYTLNDSAQLDCIETMLQAYHQLGDTRYLDAAKRGGDFLILAQLPEPQPGWAQQYNFEMEPAWARAFEPPAVCSSESAVAVRTLLDMYIETGEEKYLSPIPAFLGWLERSKLGDRRWARLYELGSNKPIYGDRDGLIHYTLNEISEERQEGYAWQGSFDIPSTIADYEAVKAKGRSAVRPQWQDEEEPPAPSQSRITRIVEQQDAQGRWLRNGWVDMRTFILNMGVLSASLEADSSPKVP